MKTIIMAGGKGTRISSIYSEAPKPMIPILNKPILEYQLENLKDQGLTDIIIVVGHLGYQIMEYFGDGSGISPFSGEPFGVQISYIIEDKPLGTAGALYLLKNTIYNDFLLVNGDIIFNVDIKRFYEFHKLKGGIATLFTHPNNHPYDSGVIIANQNSQITKWLHKEDKKQWYRNRVNAGLHFLKSDILNEFIELNVVDLDRDILQPLIPTGQLYAYDSPEYVKDIGTPDRFYSVSNDIETGKVKAKNLSNKQKAVFLDRDGTINKYVGFLNNINDFELLPGAADAIKKINHSGYLAIVITNQPVIARGEISLEDLREIHNKMETQLGEQGAYLDAIYYCPHHPIGGYAGERIEYKVECDCRKPKPGLILRAAKDFNVDLTQSWMIGDKESDMQAGIIAGCNVAKVGNAGISGNRNYQSLNECIDQIFA